MAIRIRRRKPKARPHRAQRLIRAGDRTMTFVPEVDPDDHDGLELPSEAEIEAALATAPEDLGWDWASERLIPLFERGYGEGVPGDPMVNSVSQLGVGIGYGIDFGPCVGRVTQSMAQRWEASLEQIEHAAFAHLAAVVTGLDATALQRVVVRGHLVRALGEPGGWASSVILAGEAELGRIFATRNAIFTAPARHALLAFAPGTPAQTVAEITLQLEAMDAHPLELEPFVLTDGVLRWEGLTEERFDDIR